MRDNAAGATVTHQVDHGGLAGHGADSQVRRGDPLPTRRSCLSLLETTNIRPIFANIREYWSQYSRILAEHPREY
eukprot:4555374-Prymnesium_polylepis.1